MPAYILLLSPVQATIILRSIAARGKGQHTARQWRSAQRLFSSRLHTKKKKGKYIKTCLEFVTVDLHLYMCLDG